MIIAKTPTVEIEGQPARENVRHENGVTYYTMRRLATRDSFALAGIIETGARVSEGGLQNLNLPDLETTSNTQIAMHFGKLIFSSFVYAQEELISLFASLLGVPVAAFADGDKFPMGSEVHIIQALIKHPDATALFAQLGNALGAMGRQKAPESPSQEE